MRLCACWWISIAFCVFVAKIFTFALSGSSNAIRNCITAMQAFSSTSKFKVSRVEAAGVGAETLDGYNYEGYKHNVRYATRTLQSRADCIPPSFTGASKSTPTTVSLITLSSCKLNQFARFSFITRNLRWRRASFIADKRSGAEK